MRPGFCETLEEIMYSKALLQALLSSVAVKSIFSSSAADENCVMDPWARRAFGTSLPSVSPKWCRHFDTHMNTGHEGTNNALKSNGIAVVSSHSVEQAARTINAQAMVKCGKIKQTSAKEYSRTAVWSDLLSKDDVTELCLRLVNEQWKYATNYKVFHASNESWHVVVKDGDLCSEFGMEARTLEFRGRIPIFRRIRSVTVSDGRLICSCGAFERLGYPCCHTLSVLRKEFQDHKGPCEADTSLRLHSCHALYGERPEDFPELYSLFLELGRNDVQGPKPPAPFTNVFHDAQVLIPDDFLDNPTIDCIMNPCYSDKVKL